MISKRAEDQGGHTKRFAAPVSQRKNKRLIWKIASLVKMEPATNITILFKRSLRLFTNNYCFQDDPWSTTS